MKELNREEIKQINLQVLKCLADFCEQNNINYILSDGTLLGAARHKGFIPWDMDIDVSMLRSDYEKFISLWKDNENYAVITHEKYKEFMRPFAKIVDLHTVCYEYGEKTVKGGVWVDIFPLDALPNNEKNSVKFYKKLCKAFDLFDIQLGIRKKIHGFNYFLHKVFYSLKYKDLFFFAKSTEFLLKELTALAKKYNKRDFIKVNNNISIYYKGSPYRKFGFPKECVTDFVYGEFENMEFRIPRNYDAVLKCCYNNYMQLPPKEKQIDTHGIKCFEVD